LFSVRHEFPTEWAKFKRKIECETKTAKLTSDFFARTMKTVLRLQKMLPENLISIIFKQDTLTLFLQEYLRTFSHRMMHRGLYHMQEKSLNLLERKLIELDFRNDWIPEFIDCNHSS
jgi:hypothetical protein